MSRSSRRLVLVSLSPKVDIDFRSLTFGFLTNFCLADSASSSKAPAKVEETTERKHQLAEYQEDNRRSLDAAGDITAVFLLCYLLFPYKRASSRAGSLRFQLLTSYKILLPTSPHLYRHPQGDAVKAFILHF